MSSRVSRVSRVSRRDFVAVLTALGLTGAALSPRAARAAASKDAARMEVLLILATKTDGSRLVDPQLQHLPLDRRPFKDYNEYKLLDKKSIGLEMKKATNVSLVNGKALQITLLELANERYHLLAEIAREGGKADKIDFTAGPDNSVYVAAWSQQGSRVFVGMTIKP